MPADFDERTEPATPRRRQEARRRGQVARSQDVPAAVLLLAAFLALLLLGPRLWDGMQRMLITFLSGENAVMLDDVLPMAKLSVIEMARLVAPILLLMIAAILIALAAQVGWLFSLEPLTPSLAKLNPLKGLQRVFGIRAAVVALINFGKLLIVGLVAYLTIRESAAAILFASTFTFGEMFLLGADLMFTLGVRLAVALLILSLLDYAWQKYKHERDLRMTKEEVKDEMRSMEGDPQVKRRRRQLQMQIAMQRLQHDVPKADVVITNPTHFAVAIGYEAASMPAPKVVAKGADELALRIRQIAGASGIPIIERKALARGLYDAVEVGQYVPEKFYKAIAEILAYVYALNGQSAGVRSSAAAGA